MLLEFNLYNLNHFQIEHAFILLHRMDITNKKNERKKNTEERIKLLITVHGASAHVMVFYVLVHTVSIDDSYAQRFTANDSGRETEKKVAAEQ